MRKKALYLLMLFFLSAFTLTAQRTIKSSLDTLKQLYPQEKIYIQFNKARYVAGETMWFFAYIFSGYDLSLISSNLFVELYDADKKLIQRKQLPIFSGQTAGQIRLSEKLPENIYYVRAYTQWMLNFPAGRQYLHPVEILNVSSPKKLQKIELPWKAEAFPEGGNLVDGIPTRVAVRLFSSSSLPPDWSGYLLEAGKTEKISSFNSMDQNVAITRFIPSAGKQYQIVVEDKKGQRQVVNLPAVAPAGAHLEVNNLYDSVQYIIRFKNIATGGRGYKLIGTINDQLIYEAHIRKADSVISRFIPARDLYNGVFHLSLFDSIDNLVAERLFFIKPTALEPKKPSIVDKKLNVSARSANTFELISDTLENPYAVMVLDAATESPVLKENFLSALWLSNDITRPVESPAQYFTNPDARTAEALDAILISERWRGFNWNDILTGNYTSLKYYPDNYISYKGTVTRNKKIVPKQPLNLFVYYPDSTQSIIQTRTDSLGNFVLHNMFFFDTAKVYYQINESKANAKNIDIQFESINVRAPYQPTFPAMAYEFIDRSSHDKQDEAITRAINTMNNMEYVDDRYKAMEEVRVRATMRKSIDKLNEELSSPAFRSFNETIFDFVNEEQYAQGYGNVLQWLQGRVSGLSITSQDGQMVPVIRGNPVGIYIDEMPMDPSFLNGFPISDIAMIKVIKGFFVGGSMGGGGGAVLIYTKRGNHGRRSTTPSLNNSRLKGYDKIETFPVQDYTESIYKDIKKDTRDILFWSPFTATDDSRTKTSIRFFNNDSAKEFRIIVMGFTATGEPLYHEEVIK